MFDRSKIMIMVTGTTIEPWAQNWKECYSTWIPELKKLGYPVMVAIGDPDLENYFKIEDDIVLSIVPPADVLRTEANITFS